MKYKSYSKYNQMFDVLFKSDVDVYIIDKKPKKRFQQLNKFLHTLSIQCNMVLIENTKYFHLGVLAFWGEIWGQISPQI